MLFVWLKIRIFVLRKYCLRSKKRLKANIASTNILQVLGHYDMMIYYTSRKFFSRTLFTFIPLGKRKYTQTCYTTISFALYNFSFIRQDNRQLRQKSLSSKTNSMSTWHTGKLNTIRQFYENLFRLKYFKIFQKL